ncbi:MAG: AAA family ATPase [Spirochaetales bacterium]|nr:AAA family ATPase [Spirochaetales bacterium]
MKSPAPAFLKAIHEKKPVVAISGKSGCGNTTVTTLLSKTLNFDMVNYTFRNLAEEEGIPFMELLTKAKTDSTYDRLVDTRQVALASKGNCILGSRLAVWVYPDADLKVFLTADPDTRARRIQKREGGAADAVLNQTRARDAQDHQRYLDLYGIDNNEYSFVDLVLDTTQALPEELVQVIIENLGKKFLVDPF